MGLIGLRGRVCSASGDRAAAGPSPSFPPGLLLSARLHTHLGEKVSTRNYNTINIIPSSRLPAPLTPPNVQACDTISPRFPKIEYRQIPPNVCPVAVQTR